MASDLFMNVLLCSAVMLPLTIDKFIMQAPGTGEGPSYRFGARLSSVRTLQRSNDPQLRAPEKVPADV